MESGEQIGIMVNRAAALAELRMRLHRLEREVEIGKLIIRAVESMDLTPEMDAALRSSAEGGRLL